MLFAVAGALFWLTTPWGAQDASSWATAEVSHRIPDTRVKIGKIRLHWPPEVEAESVTWKKLDGSVILSCGRLSAAIYLDHLLKGYPILIVSVPVDRLNLAILDRAVAKGEWRATGELSGYANLVLFGRNMEDVDLRLEAEKPGGTLSGQLIQRLLSFMPSGDARSKLLKALQGQDLFHFKEGKVRIEMDMETYQVNLFLDGDHLLDVTIRVSKDSVGALAQLLRLGGGS